MVLHWLLLRNKKKFLFLVNFSTKLGNLKNADCLDCKPNTTTKCCCLGNPGFAENPRMNNSVRQEDGVGEEAPIYGGWSMKVYTSVFLLVEHTWYAWYACVMSEETLCLKKMPQEQHQWAELVCSSLIMNSLCGSFKNTDHIFIFLSLHWVLHHNAQGGGVSVQKHSTWNVKDETQERILSRCYNTLLFTAHFLLSNGLSHLVPPRYTHTSSNVSL